MINIRVQEHHVGTLTVNDYKMLNKTRRVLTGQLPPQQQPLGHGQYCMNCHPNSSYGPETNFAMGEQRP